MALTTEKKILYMNTFCKYRETLPYKIGCRHPWGYKICDLDLCPIAQPYFANIVFQPNGIFLLFKKPSESKAAGEVEFIKLDIDIDRDNHEEILELVERTVGDSINEKMLNALKERVLRIYQRYKFLKSKGIELSLRVEETRLEEEAEESELSEEEGTEEGFE